MCNIAIVLIIHACYKKINDKRRAKSASFYFSEKFEKSRKVYIFVKSLPKL